MALAAGARLGPYEIQSLIGAGGMGEVYRARDSRLDRTVALKILPEHLASDPERRTRLEREARAIAALNHPHICTFHDVGQQDGTTYLVMEHLDGVSLATRLRRGRLPLAAVLEIGAQIADALAAAHKAGIIHRDLKPANVMLVGGGAHRARTGAPVTVKLLDFGLAKLTGHGDVAAVTSGVVATETATLTARGTIVGTLPFMAPEQVQGLPADARTDIWALGAILYEMASGTRAFDAPSATSLVGAILERDPAPLVEKAPLVPPALDRLVCKCLAKAPEDRWDSAHDLADELRWIAATAAQPTQVGSRPTSWSRTALRVGLPTAIVAGLMGGLAIWYVRPSSPGAVVRTQLNVQPAEDAYGGGFQPSAVGTRGGSRTILAWAPNGQTLVFVGRHRGVRQLYVRNLDGAEARPLAGTEDAQMPVVSRDGRSVVFWANDEIRRVPLDGGPAQTLVPAVSFPPRGMAVGVSGSVAFSTVTGEIRQATSGSTPTPVTTLQKGEMAHLLPHFLPADAVLLYTVATSEWTSGHERVVAQVLATSERKLLLQDATDARYVSTGHLVFLRRGVLMAVPFDLARLAVTGAPVAVLDGIAQALTSFNNGDVTRAGQFSVSATGALAYVPSPVVKYPDFELVTVDRRGRVSVLPGEVHSYSPGYRLSPDGRLLAITIANVTELALWIADLTRPGSLTKVTVGGEAGAPTWTPDGQHIAFFWLKNGIPEVVWQRADGSAPAATLASGPFIPISWSPDQQRLALEREGDIWLVTLSSGQPRLTRMTETPETEWSAEFSPDGKWLAYTSDKTGRIEVYLKPATASAPVTLVSVAGGGNPAWNPRGGELFFTAPTETGGRRLMAVSVRDGRVSSPVSLFDVPSDLGFSCIPRRCYDVTPDGQRFIAFRLLPRDPPPPVTHINLVLNWVEELKAKVPARGTSAATSAAGAAR